MKFVVIVATIAAALIFAATGLAAVVSGAVRQSNGYTGQPNARVDIDNLCVYQGGHSTTYSGSGGSYSFGSGTCGHFGVQATYYSGCYVQYSNYRTVYTNEYGNASGQDVVLGSPQRWC